MKLHSVFNSHVRILIFNIPKKRFFPQGYLAYNELCESKYSDYNKKYDKAAKTNYLVKGNQWITYDDRATIRFKVSFK